MDATQPEGIASRRERLSELRDSLHAALFGGEIAVREYAALSKEYRAVLAELDALPNSEEVSVADEIAQRRANRRTGAPRQAHG